MYIVVFQLPIEYLVRKFLLLPGSKFLRYSGTRNHPGVVECKVSIPIKEQNPTRKHPKAGFCGLYSSRAGHPHPPLDCSLTLPFYQLMCIEIIVGSTLVTMCTIEVWPPSSSQSKSLPVFNTTHTCICRPPGQIMFPRFWVCRYIRKLYLSRVLKLLLISHFYIIAKPI